MGTNKKEAPEYFWKKLKEIRDGKFREGWYSLMNCPTITSSRPEGRKSYHNERYHDLRHTFASHRKMAGLDDFTLMEIMGRSDIKMMRRHAHLTPEHKPAAIARLPNWRVTDSKIQSAER